jgi:hypothetical protein
LSASFLYPPPVIVSQLKGKTVFRHCERSEAIQLKTMLWIASGFAFAMTSLYFALKLTAETRPEATYLVNHNPRIASPRSR